MATIASIMYGNNFSFAQVKAIVAKEQEKNNRYTAEKWREKDERQNRKQPEKDDEIRIHLNPSTIKKIKALGRNWKSKLSAKVEEWVEQGAL